MVLTLLVAGMAYAEPTDNGDLTSLSLEDLTQVKVYSASRHLEDSRNAPSAVSIITAEDISRFGWRTLADALRSLRGFYTAYDRNYSYLGVRGFLRAGDYNTRILLLINGHRLNDNVYDGAEIGTEFPLDLDLIDHIEIVRGPSSSLFGTNAVFGVVNVITRKPASDGVLEASGDTSSFFGRTGRLTANFKRGGMSALLSGSLYRSDGQPRLFYPEFNTPENNYGFADNIDGDRSAQFFSDVQYGNFRVQSLFASRMKIVPTASFDTNFNDPGTRTTDSRGYFDVSYHRSFSSSTDLDVRTYYDAYRFYGTTAYGGTNSPDRVLNFDYAAADWVGIEATLSHHVGRYRFTGGANYEHNFRVDQRNYYTGQAPALSDHRTPWLLATYGEAELSLTEKLKIHAGGRLDYFDETGATFSPRVALIYSPTSRMALKYIFGRAFRAPNAYESHYADFVVIEPPSTPLKPENIQSHEVVFESSLSSWLRMTADAFYNHLDKLIDLVPDPATGLTQFVNGGNNRGRGVELELEAKRASGLAARASYRLAEAKDSITNQRLDNSPLNTAKLNATVPLSKQAFAGLELLYSSSENSYRDTRVPPRFLANITLSTKPLWDGWQFSADCYNLFDRRWFSPASLEHRQAVIQQDGRTYRFKVTYRLPLRHAVVQP